jgi:hypothetical protein
MRRVAVLVWLVLASPLFTYLPLAPLALATELPIPPIPPPSPPSATAAPIPDNDVDAPAAAVQTGPRLALKFYRAQTYDPGMGFGPGSRYRTSEDRKPIQTPGFSVSVPLD